MHRREWMSQFGLAVGGAGLGMPETYAKATRGLPPLKITNVKAILTNPPYANGSFSFMQRLVIAKVETSEPGLYGLGCASLCAMASSLRIRVGLVSRGSMISSTSRYSAPWNG